MTMTDLHAVDAADLDRLERIARIGRELADAADKTGSAKWRPVASDRHHRRSLRRALFGALGAILAIVLRH